MTLPRDPDESPGGGDEELHSGRGIQRITVAMSAGSILGATLGGLAVAYAEFLKVLLGCKAAGEAAARVLPVCDRRAGL